MRYLEYMDKETKQKAVAIDADSILEDMEMAERFHGSTEGAIHASWYDLKRQILNASVVQPEKKEEQ